MTTITAVKGRQILDSRGLPTVEAEIRLSNDLFAIASVPSGASTGQYEALELRDHDPKVFLGKGVKNAVAHINSSLAQALVGMGVPEDAHYTGVFDQIMLEIDGTPNKAKLGANAILAVSLALAKVMALNQHMPLYAYLMPQSNYQLPVPMMNVLNGGAHADNGLDFQEFMLIPVGAATFSESMRYGVETFYALKHLLKKRGLTTAVGDEGGFAPSLKSHQEAIELLLLALEDVGLVPGKEVYIGLDIASSEFFKDDRYHLSREGKTLTSDEFVIYLKNFARDYPILSIEDGAAETDYSGWQLLTKELGGKVQLVGDDVFVTNTALLRQGIEQGMANAILIKPNQIGCLSETLAAMALAKDANYATVVSHRSGETEDTFIADLAVATNAGQIKTGSVCRTDRTAKYNQLLRIEESLGVNGSYAGIKGFGQLKLCE